MSEVVRLDAKMLLPGVCVSEQGSMVWYTSYAALLAEVKLLREVQQWAAACDCKTCEYCQAVDALAKHCNPELVDANGNWKVSNAR